ncbi:putative odorant receptor 19b [Drosophila eugracilis]|uniref:putative odorant receptor 19b n=1 Tax=Drosophila eugracilis TaxID=29029 RepID=UPI0007E68619|nr:putative odorant receptor 19b [Drosophila eugracilis]
MEKVKADSTRALVNHWRIFRLIGVHPPSKDTMWGRNYTLYSIVWNVTFHLFIWLSFSVNFLLSNSLETFCESLCVAMPHTLYMLKLFNVYWTRNELLHSNRVFRYLDRRLVSSDEFRIVNEGVQKAEFIFRIISHGVVVIVALAIFYISVASEPTLMYPSWIPWNWKDSSTLCLPTIILHSSAITETALTVLSLSTYPGTYLILVSAHTKALAFRVSKLGYGRRLSEDRMLAILNGYIKDHQIILKLFKSLERSLSMTCFLQFVCTASAQCTICYFLLFEQVGIMRFANMAMLLVAFTTETILLCYTAELLCKEGESLLTAVYSSNWLDQSVRFRRHLLLMLVRCKKPLILVSGAIVPVSMKTFMLMIKGAYTMLTLLNEMRKSSLENN